MFELDSFEPCQYANHQSSVCIDLILLTQASILVSIFVESSTIHENKLSNFFNIAFGRVDETVCSIQPYG
jgi:hypothetical protein